MCFHLTLLGLDSEGSRYGNGKKGVGVVGDRNGKKKKKIEGSGCDVRWNESIKLGFLTKSIKI